MTMLFDALRRAGCGEKNEGIVLIDGGKVYRHWVEDGKVFFEAANKDAAFADQDVQFDEGGGADAVDSDGQVRRIRVLVMVPFSAKLQALDLIMPPEREAA